MTREQTKAFLNSIQEGSEEQMDLIQWENATNDQRLCWHIKMSQKLRQVKQVMDKWLGMDLDSYLSMNQIENILDVK